MGLTSSRRFGRGSVAAVLGLLPACVGPDIEYGDTRTVEVQQASTPIYRLRPGDQIDISFAYHSQRNISLTIRPDGRISMPFAEEVMAAGRTPDELDAELTRHVISALKDADLSVVVRGFAQQLVYVGGEVAKPGELSLIPGMTAYQALAKAGWILPSAADDSVVLVRHVGPGRREAVKLDFSEEQLIAHDVELQAFDILYVPKTSIARVGTWVDQNVNKVIPRVVNVQLGYTFRTFQTVD